MRSASRKSASLIIAALAVFILARPGSAHAQLGSAVCDMTVNFSNAVPVWDQSTQAMKNAKCTGDGFAWQAAHVVLHALTTSVVNWINSGFQGSPSFVTNPGAFFADTADQVTGALISDTGPLAQALCSPFSLDIRLALALNQAQIYDERYTCTLSTVLQNAQNSHVSVGASVSQNPNGATLGDFMNGGASSNANAVSVNGQSIDGFYNNFSQGGWDAYMAMTTDPQSNQWGAYAMADSDQRELIAERQGQINNDLNRGNGFLSWQKCDNVPSEGQTHYDQNLNAYVNNSGGSTQQVCHTETPGSVISSSLNSSLQGPAQELQLTNEINEVVSALFSQLMSHVLSNGLLSSSQVSVGAGNSISQSYVNQLSNDPQLQANFSNLKNQAVASINQMTIPIQQAITYRDQAATLMDGVQSQYQSTRACIAAEVNTNSTADPMTLASSNLEPQLTALDAYISDTVTPQVDRYQQMAADAHDWLGQIQQVESQLASAATAADMYSANDTLNSLLASTSTAADPSLAKSDLNTATTLSKNMQSALAPYQSLCTTGATAIQ
ncbi:MAG: hypothetical protein KGI66_01100 [Patescibacteria group bacterium]|nr:hypothetical protein [Patescibacteria group bacterium]